MQLPPFNEDGNQILPIVNQPDIEQLLGLDPVFGRIHELYGAPPNWSRPQGFVSLVKIILEQQVSLASANAHFNKLNGFIPAFTPTEILKLTDEEMRASQISRQKTVYLRALATALEAGSLNLESLAGKDEVTIRQDLTRIKGIGDWTTDIYLMFCLQAKDIFPMGDIAVINAVRELKGQLTKDEIVIMSEKWKPFRSLAAYYFWHYYLKKRGR